MARPSRSRRRYRVGDVSVYEHHGAWWLYFRDDGKPRRRRIGPALDEAKTVAAQVNADLAAKRPTMLSFEPVAIPTLRQRWLEYHRDVLNSSPATVKRYTTATAHLITYVASVPTIRHAHQLAAGSFIGYLRRIHVAPNGHPNAAKRPLRDKGIKFVLGACRAMYRYAGTNRMLPPYTENPFAVIQIDRLKVEDAKPIHVFTESQELEFLSSCDDWQWPIFFLLARLGLRVGELLHLEVEDLDRERRILHIRNKSDVGWLIKTRAQRAIPLPPQTVEVLDRLIHKRTTGLVVQRRAAKRTATLRDAPRRDMIAAYESLTAQFVHEDNVSSLQEHRRCVAERLWRDRGMLRASRLRNEFMRLTSAIGLPDVTAPKCWRHTFATLMQEAGVDPLVRQITLGHSAGRTSALGMTANYTHTQTEFHRSQLQRVIDLRPAVAALVRDRLS